MRRLRVLFLAAVLLLKPWDVFADEYGKYLPKWFELLNKGDHEEKKLALKNLWFLEYDQYRKDKKVFDPVYAALGDKDPSVREAAADLLKRIGEYSKGCCLDTRILETLVKALKDADPRVRREAAKALAYYRDQGATLPLADSLKDTDPWVRLEAAFALGETGGMNGIRPLLDMLDGGSDWRDNFARQEAVVAIGKIRKRSFSHDREIVAVLMKKSDDPYLKAGIIKVLGEIRAPEAEDLFLKAAKDPDENIRKVAAEALANLPVTQEYGAARRRVEAKREEKNDIFLGLLKDPSPGARAAAARSLGESGDSRAVGPLISALDDGDREVVRSAIEALARFDDEKVFSALAGHIAGGGAEPELASEQFGKLSSRTAERKLEKKSTGGSFTSLVNKTAATALLGVLDRAGEYSKYRIVMLLGVFEDPRVAPRLKSLVDDPSPLVRKWAVFSLRGTADRDIVPVAVKKLKDADPAVRTEAARLLGGFPNDKQALEPLLQALDDGSWTVRSAALYSLGYYDDPRVFESAVKMLKSDDSDNRRIAINVIRRKPDKKAVEPLIEALNDADFLVPSYAAEALGVIGDKRAVEPLIDAMEGRPKRNRTLGGDTDLRRNSAKALGAFKDKRAVGPLTKAFLNREEDAYLRCTAASSLGEIGDPSALDALNSFLTGGKDADPQYSYCKRSVEGAVEKLKGNRR